MTQSSIELHSISEAIEAIKKGEVIIVVDDADRENEGDFVAAAETITPEMINFMATHGRGLICTPLTEERCQELQLGKNGLQQYRSHGNGIYGLGGSQRKRGDHWNFGFRPSTDSKSTRGCEHQAS